MTKWTQQTLAVPTKPHRLPDSLQLNSWVGGLPMVGLPAFRSHSEAALPLCSIHKAHERGAREASSADRPACPCFQL